MTNKELLEQIEEDILKVEQDMQGLRVKLSTLKEIKSKITGKRRRGSPSGANSEKDGGLMGAGKAIRAIVQKQPGIQLEVVVESLQGQIKTKARNQERLLRNTVANMLRDEILGKDESGGLILQEDQGVR